MTDADDSSSASDTEDEEVELIPGSRTARLYELFSVDLWWSLGMMAVAGFIATVLFVATAADPLRVAGMSVGLGTALVYAGRLIWLRGLSDTRIDEWVSILAQAAVIVGLTEIVVAVLSLFDGLP